MANFFKINDVVNNNSLPRLPYMVNSGSLLLMDNNLDMVDITPFHSNFSQISVTNGSYELPLVNRVPDAQVKSILGSNISNAIALRAIKDTGGHGQRYADFGTSKTTTKGGLYMSMGLQVAANTTSLPGITSIPSGGSTSLGAGIRLKVESNRTAQFFGSAWYKVVTPKPANAGHYYVMLLGGNANTGVYAVDGTNNFSASHGNIGNFKEGNIYTAGMFKAQTAGTWKSDNGAAYSMFQNFFTGAGLTADLILYRLYIEDLSVSGLSWEQAKANDDMLYESAFSSGGRLFGDTISTPSP